MFQWQPYALLPLIGVVFAVVFGVYAVRHRASTPAANPFILLNVGLCAWATEDTVGGFLTSLEVRSNLALLRFPAVATTVLGLCWFCVVMVDNDVVISRRWQVLLLVEPVLVTIAAATNGWHRGLITATELVGQPSMLRIYVGPLFYVQSVYCYTLIAGVFVVALRAMRTASDLQRRQLGTIIVAALFPMIGNIVTLAQFSHGGGGDYAVLGFGVSTLFAGWAAFRQGLLRTNPIARGLVLDRVSDAVVVLDRYGREVDRNRAADRLIGVIRSDHATGFLGRLTAGLLTDDTSALPPDGEHTTMGSGGRIDLDIRSTELLDRQGKLLGHVVVARDVTESNDQKNALRAALGQRDELAEALRHQAFHDSLTGLANRALFGERLADEHTRARRAGVGTVVMFIDLDDFKPVNDRLGHHAGDVLLQQVAARLSAILRPVDTVARLGGDEFAVILALPAPESVSAMAARLIVALRMPFMIQDEQVQIGASIGVAIDRNATGEPDQLLREADAAMYDAKRRGKGAFTVSERGDVAHAAQGGRPD